MITSDNVIEYNPGQFVIEASNLSLVPGYFPQTIPSKIGNKLNFTFRNFIDNAAIYQQEFGSITLKVLND